MKKILLIAIMLLSVVCFASPPPEIVSDIVTDDVGWVVQDNVTVNDIYVTEIFAANLPEYGVVVQEVAFVDIGNMNLSDATITDNYTIAYNDANISKQHSHYGYPFGADYTANVSYQNII